MKCPNKKDEDIPNDDTCLNPGQPCFFDAECCLDDTRSVSCEGVNRTANLTETEQKGRCTSIGYSGPGGQDDTFLLEPFCLAYGNSGGEPTSFAWTPLLAWPPINADPYVAWFLPWCYFGSVGQCKFCELTNGVEGKVISIGGIPHQTTFQFSGFAFSWAEDEGTLELNAGDGIRIWDGFLNRDLVVPG